MSETQEKPFSAAPFIYTFLQILLFGICLKNSKELTNFNDFWIQIFWVDVALCFISYIFLAKRDPGFVPVDKIPLADTSSKMSKIQQMSNFLSMQSSYEAKKQQEEKLNTITYGSQLNTEAEQKVGSKQKRFLNRKAQQEEVQKRLQELQVISEKKFQEHKQCTSLIEDNISPNKIEKLDYINNSIIKTPNQNFNTSSDKKVSIFYQQQKEGEQNLAGCNIKKKLFDFNDNNNIIQDEVLDIQNEEENKNKNQEKYTNQVTNIIQDNNISNIKSNKSIQLSAQKDTQINTNYDNYEIQCENTFMDTENNQNPINLNLDIMERDENDDDLNQDFDIYNKSSNKTNSTQNSKAKSKPSSQKKQNKNYLSSQKKTKQFETNNSQSPDKKSPNKQKQNTEQGIVSFSTFQNNATTAITADNLTQNLYECQDQAKSKNYNNQVISTFQNEISKQSNQKLSHLSLKIQNSGNNTQNNRLYSESSPNNGQESCKRMNYENDIFHSIQSEKTTNQNTNRYLLPIKHQFSNFNSQHELTSMQPENEKKSIYQNLKDKKNLLYPQINQQQQIFKNNENNNNKQKGNQQEINININNNNDTDIDNDEYHNIYLEKRYCNECHLEQPIRSKHCKDCNRCIATYDHHCPWIGTCIGERNRCLFYWYLIFQFIQIIVPEIYTIISIAKQDGNSEFLGNVLPVIAVIIGAFFAFMVGVLILYHTFLMTGNLTTWENVSWEKISYLKDLDEDNGSPFSFGFFKNIKFYCKCRFINYKIINWKYTKYYISKFIQNPKKQIKQQQQQQQI